MNELNARRLIAQAVNATGKIGTEKQFWTTVLTGLKGSFSSANNEHEFWRKFASLLKIKVAPLPATSKVVASGDTVPVQDFAGVAKGNGVVTIAGGAVTSVRPAATVAVIQSTVKVTAPAITGTYVNGYTFTVANGVITAIVAS